MKYYAYVLPQQNRSGITEGWAECEKLVSRESGARYKAFRFRAAAEKWLRAGARYEQQHDGSARRASFTIKPGIYFDAGTGRGRGVEISVTDEQSKNLLHKVLPRALINEFGKHRLGKEATNNYGELLALKYALDLALKDGGTRIFGDSKLVIDYWSKGLIRKKKVVPETVVLATKVKQLRKKFEKSGGGIARIPGSVNPADLGFH